MKPADTGDIEDALDIAARIIDRFGYRYWPIFERLEAELENRTSREMRIQARLNPAMTETNQSGQPSRYQ
ncbi:MAG: hypothetical protein CMN25_02650 [Salinicola sp.]|jgi:hypothetical protein|nr:hypothetical protein [Salinicola sp.]|tara:strand:- start:6227 stop:6436 length:210 start_codon:yes stop_codon:yes gene_type:complete